MRRVDVLGVRVSTDGTRLVVCLQEGHSGRVLPIVVGAREGAAIASAQAGVVHAGIGKASFETDKLAQNLRAFVDAVSRAKPSGAKGTYMKKVSISSTMGPGVSIDVVSATQA